MRDSFMRFGRAIIVVAVFLFLYIYIYASTPRGCNSNTKNNSNESYKSSNNAANNCWKTNTNTPKVNLAFMTMAKIILWKRSPVTKGSMWGSGEKNCPHLNYHKLSVELSLHRPALPCPALKGQHSDYNFKTDLFDEATNIDKLQWSNFNEPYIVQWVKPAIKLSNCKTYSHFTSTDKISS